MLTTVVVAAAGSLSACSSEPERSPEQFCAVYSSEKAKFQDRYSSVGSGEGTAAPDGGKVLTDLILGIQSLGDVAVILDKLDKVAPSDIEPDVAAVRDSWKSMQGSLGDEADNAFNPAGLFGAALRGILNGIQSNGSWERVGTYISQHCTNDR